MGRVLVIEDEEMLRRSMVRALGKLPGVEVVGAGNLADALRSIDDHFPDLILSDLDLPDRSGIELIGEISGRGRFVPIVFISAYLEAYGSRIPPHAGVRALEKPVALDDLRALVLEQLNASGSGEPISPFGAVDYLQLAAMGGHSVEISVSSPGEQGGSLFVHEGEIWHAEDSDGEGPEALARLIGLKPSTTACRSAQEAPPRRSVEGRWEELVLDAVRRADESARDDAG
nr:response regulator [Myxococcota bacterium]